jgi:hypothetical protein
LNLPQLGVGKGIEKDAKKKSDKGVNFEKSVSQTQSLFVKDAFCPTRINSNTSLVCQLGNLINFCGRRKSPMKYLEASNSPLEEELVLGYLPFSSVRYDRYQSSGLGNVTGVASPG